jgi:hypothetical protein
MQSVLFNSYFQESNKCKAYYLLLIFKKLWEMWRLLFTSCIQKTPTNAKLTIYFIFSRKSDKCKRITYFIYSRNSVKCKEQYLLHIFNKLLQMQRALFISCIQETLTNAKRIILFMFSRNSDKYDAHYLFHIFKKLWQMQRVLFTSCIQKTLTNAKCIIYFIYSRNSYKFEVYNSFILSRNSDKRKAYYVIHIFKKHWLMQIVLFTSWIQECLTNEKRIIYLMYSRNSDKFKTYYLLNIF